MNRQIFSSLPAQKRCDILWDEGQFLGSVKYYRFKANLYALNSFFVEVFCYQGSTEIIKIEVVDEANLVKYLNHIDVGSVIGIKDIL
jgi:hypothetical protein